MQRASVDEHRAATLGNRFRDPARSGHVRLLRVVGLALRERPAGLRGEQEDALGALGEEPVDLLAVSDVGGLHAGASRLELCELLPPRRVPVVGEHDVGPSRECTLCQRRSDVPRAEHEDQGRAMTI